jgi:capsular exopolysaccharide synthesis family protein
MQPRTDHTPTAAQTDWVGEGIITYYWMVLQKRKWVVFTFAFALVLSVTVATTLSTPYYSATAVIEISPKADTVLDVAEVSEFVTASSSSELRNYYATQYKVMQSRSVVGETINLLETTHGINDFGDVEKPIDAFRGLLSIQPVVETHLVNITVEYPDPDKAALFADTLAVAYMELNMDRALKSNQRAIKWLQEQVTDYRGKKRASDVRVHEFRTENNLVGLSERYNSTLGRLETLQQAWGAASTDRIQVQAVFEELSSLAKQPDQTPLAQHLAASSPVLQELLSRRDELLQKKSSLSSRAGEKHPEMVKVNRELASVQSRIGGQVDELVLGKRAEFQVALQREEALTAELNLAKAEVESLDGKLIELKLLEGDAERNKQLYESIDRRLSEVDLTHMLRNNNIRVVDPAVATDAPVRPQMAVNVVMGLMLGLFGGCGLAFLLDLFDTTIKSKEDVESVIGVPLLGVVPGVPDPELQTLPDDVSRSLFVHSRPRSTVAECMRSIRTNMMFRVPKKDTRIILITSAAPREGKSFTSSNLAAIIAMTGSRVLLIDADLRRPALHHRFGLTNHRGLATLFTENARLTDLIEPTHIRDLEVIVAGPPPPNPGELLGGGKLQEALRHLKQYDFIIIDTPPVNVVADPLVLATIADGVLLVVEADRTSRNMVRQAGARLSETSAPVIGAVVNKLDIRTSGYSYSYYDNYGYYYTEAEQEAQGRTSA